MQLEWRGLKSYSRKYEYEIVKASGDRGYFFIVYKLQAVFYVEWDEEETLYVSPLFATETEAKAAAQDWENEHG
jgi:hypothetical protein